MRSQDISTISIKTLKWYPPPSMNKVIHTFVLPGGRRQPGGGDPGLRGLGAAQHQRSRQLCDRAGEGPGEPRGGSAHQAEPPGRNIKDRRFPMIQP